MPTSIGSSLPAAAPASGSNKSISGFADNFDSFLTLLTAQLKNQDPLSPLDATQFTTQLVQFTGVEQAIRQNQSLETLISLQRDAGAGAAAGYLGKTVATNGNSITLANGVAKLNYALANPAAGTAITVLDSDGKVIKTLVGQNSSGAHTAVWDGVGDDGVRRPDGAYTVRVTARDSNNNPIAVTTGANGVVNKVSFNGGKIMLTVGDSTIPLSDVVSVSTSSNP